MYPDAATKTVDKVSNQKEGSATFCQLIPEDNKQACTKAWLSTISTRLGKRIRFKKAFTLWKMSALKNEAVAVRRLAKVRNKKSSCVARASSVTVKYV